MGTLSNLDQLFTSELRAAHLWFDRLPTGKIPVDDHGFPISFKGQAKTYERLRRPEHSCFRLESPFLGLDFDWKNPNGSENLEKKQRAYELISLLPATYAELSVSGNGCHLFYMLSAAEHAQLPNQTCGEFEVYARERQFAMTGNQMPGSLLAVTTITLLRAFQIFKLAAPNGVMKPKPEVEASGEPGYWEPAALLALLEAYSKYIPGFWFKPCRVGYAVPCPGETGWPDGARHSQRRLVQNTLVFMRNGWPCFECFHAHCQAKTIKDWWTYYDPFKLYFDFDEWQEKAILEADARFRAEYGGAR